MGDLYGQTEQDVEFKVPEKTEKPYHPSHTEKEFEKVESGSLSGYALKRAGDSRGDKKKYTDHSEKSDWSEEETAEEVSTLSFNIFLYVLDRFKED
ncbi:hypothetical protein [Cyclobacterium lianum]|nr:hypothetical protein [Cyclobacterium lianum]